MPACNELAQAEQLYTDSLGETVTSLSKYYRLSSLWAWCHLSYHVPLQTNRLRLQRPTGDAWWISVYCDPHGDLLS